MIYLRSNVNNPQSIFYDRDCFAIQDNNIYSLGDWTLASESGGIFEFEVLEGFYLTTAINCDEPKRFYYDGNNMEPEFLKLTDSGNLRWNTFVELWPDEEKELDYTHLSSWLYNIFSTDQVQFEISGPQKIPHFFEVIKDDEGGKTGKSLITLEEAVRLLVLPHDEKKFQKLFDQFI